MIPHFLERCDEFTGRAPTVLSFEGSVGNTAGAGSLAHAIALLPDGGGGVGLRGKLEGIYTRSYSQQGQDRGAHFDCCRTWNNTVANTDL